MENQIGRVKLYTDVPFITMENVGEIVRSAYNDYLPSKTRMDFLFDYEKGVQPLMRTKTYRKDIDCKCVDNVANEITDFKTGFIWGNPITFIQSGKEDEFGEDTLKAIAELNRCYDSQSIKRKTQHLARNVEITGIGYTYVDIDTMADVENGDSYFQIESLDPRNAFVVYSSYYVDERPMLGVIVGKNSDGTLRFTCFSIDSRYELNNLYEHKARSGEMNPLNAIPLIEWFRDYDRMGCFERQIDEMNNLNLLVSDFTNDVEQNTQAVWHTNDVDFPVEIVENEDGTKTEVTRRPKNNEWLSTYTSTDGKTPFIKPLAVEYDYQGMLNNIVTRRALILEKCNVPQRGSSSGGNTSLALDNANGWNSAESSAAKQQNIMESCKMEEVKVVLKAIKKHPKVEVDSPLLNLKPSDVRPNISRLKTFELSTKINFFATAVSHGIYGLHALKAMNVFDDNNKVWEDSKELIEAYQRSIFDKNDTTNNAEGGEDEKKPNADRLMTDLSDQTSNSPNLQG